jgi:hypothetical protein
MLAARDRGKKAAQSVGPLPGYVFSFYALFLTD